MDGYDVSLNHRGPDDKVTFITHLDDALRSAGLNPLRVRKTSLMKEELDFRSVDFDRAQIHVAIVSKGYAESRYCLSELAAMMRSRKPVIPVFYDVEPAHLRRVENGPFAAAFEGHKSRESAEQVKEWADALRNLADITGFCFRFSDYQDVAELKQEVVDAIMSLRSTNEGLQIEHYLVDNEHMNTCVYKLEKLCGATCSLCPIECGHPSPMETLELYLKVAEECIEGVQRMSLRKFNNEQCNYLVDKLKVVVHSASLFLQVLHAEHHGSYSAMDGKGHVEIFKLLLALSKQIETFVQGCCKDAWIQAAMTLTNVTEYVSSLGFNLELLRIVFTFEHATIGSLTLEMVDAIDKAEIESVKKKTSIDVDTLFEKVILELNSLSCEDRDLTSYLLQRLKKVKPIPTSILGGSSFWNIIDDRSFLGKLFKRVQQTVRLGKCVSGATVDKAMWLGTPVAIKTFYGPEDPEFMKEVGILARLYHPHITSMFCNAMDRRKCSIVMELMDEDLHDLMQRRLDANSDSPPFTILEAVDIMLQISEGVNYLHNKQIEHRDLKSLNILIKSVKAGEFESRYVYAKVADFGLSKIKESSIRFSNQTFNTGINRWMAPEIINLDSLNSQRSTSSSENEPKFSFKCDVYSFAMVCYEILTGEIPFSTIRNPNKVKKKVMEGDHPDLPYNCPHQLKTLIEKCWNQEPRERPSFAKICLELKYLKYLLMTCFIQGSHQASVESLQEE